MKKDGRERARDADDALAMLKEPPVRAEEDLERAAQNDQAADRQKALEQAAAQQVKLAAALNKLAEHYDNVEKGKNPDETRTALRATEQPNGVKEQLDQEFAKAEELAKMAAASPPDLLAQLEKALPQNPQMRAELSSISRNTLKSAEQQLQHASGQENAVAQQVDKVATDQQAQAAAKAKAQAEAQALAQAEAQAKAAQAQNPQNPATARTRRLRRRRRRKRHAAAEHRTNSCSGPAKRDGRDRSDQRGTACGTEPSAGASRAAADAYRPDGWRSRQRCLPRGPARRAPPKHEGGGAASATRAGHPGNRAAAGAHRSEGIGSGATSRAGTARVERRESRTQRRTRPAFRSGEGRHPAKRLTGRPCERCRSSASYGRPGTKGTRYAHRSKRRRYASLATERAARRDAGQRDRFRSTSVRLARSFAERAAAGAISRNVAR